MSGLHCFSWLLTGRIAPCRMAGGIRSAGHFAMGAYVESNEFERPSGKRLAGCTQWQPGAGECCRSLGTGLAWAGIRARLSRIYLARFNHDPPVNRRSIRGPPLTIWWNIQICSGTGSTSPGRNVADCGHTLSRCGLEKMPGYARLGWPRFAEVGNRSCATHPGLHGAQQNATERR